MNQQQLTANDSDAQVQLLYTVTERGRDQAAAWQAATNNHHWTAAVFIHKDTADRT